ncbi:zinc finger MYM-type protein 1-like [Acyrthosiphon pisum]|uniref:Zinc finger MYM-type protein 1-like n=1 Tax=Acyrthosiphon pisum TaxID=7029 RepID=A0A8R2FEA0_ACYPI|nr:zinc finger MYM-type protein 1-like [Acyrthosiphon pisum]|eukprot:XP_008189949.1 PREDICTED: zinc finger MYM-type protein 1-like [Acyrthosiphon pisum]
MKRLLRQSILPIIPSLQSRKKEQVFKNREIVKQLIDITLYLGRHGLAFRGHREGWDEQRKGNFKDLIILISKYSPIMAQYITEIKIQKYPTTFIDEEIFDARFFSISIDSTFDISRKEQVSFVIRYVQNDTVKERFVALKESPNTRGVDLAELFYSVCTDHNLDWKHYLIGQPYDGAASMRGQYTGLQSIINEQNTNAVYIWCWAHRLNLVAIDAVSSGNNAMDLFGNLEQIFDFVCSSKKRVSLYEKNQKTINPKLAIRRFKRVTTTRWMSHYYALCTVLKTFNTLIETLQVIRDTEGPGDRRRGITAGGLLKYFTSEIFLLTAYSFENMFKILDKTSQHLQSPDFDIYCATMLIEDNLKYLNKLRTDELFNEISDQTKKFIIDSDYEFEPLPQHRSRKRKQMADENAIDELTERLIGNNNTSSNISKSPDKSTLGLLKDISLLSKKRLNEVKQNIKNLPVDAFDVFGKIYSKFVQPDNARHEYKEFCNYFELLEKCESLPNMLHDNRDTAVCFEDSDINQEEDFDSENDKYLISNKEDDDASEKNIKNHGSLSLIYRLFCNHGSLKIMFPTLFTMYKIALTLPVGSVETERSFSKLKIVKNRLRSTMSNDRLEALMRINCDQDIDIDYTCFVRV